MPTPPKCPALFAPLQTLSRKLALINKTRLLNLLFSAADASKVRVWGRGVAPNGVRVGDDTCWLKADTRHAGDADSAVKVLGPDKQPLRVVETAAPGDDRTTVYRYTPVASGRHEVVVTFGGEHAALSPYEVLVAPRSALPVAAYGPGLASAVANLPADFTLDTRGASGQIGR